MSPWRSRDSFLPFLMLRIIFYLLFILGLICPGFSEAAILLPFQGEIEFPQKEFSITINPKGQNPLSIKITQKQENLYQALVKIDHMKTPFFDDISTVLEGVIEVIREDDNTVRALSGKIGSKYTLINYKPVEEAFGLFEVKGDNLYFNSLSVGNALLRGSVQIVAPYALDLSVQLSSVPMSDFLTFFVGKHEIAADGTVTGEIHISGKLDQVQLKGNLASYYGLVHTLNYDNITLNAEGIYPIIHISESNITQADGVTFNIAGNIDLSDKGNFKKQIRLLTKQPLIRSEGEELEWTLKRLRSQEHSGTTELKYLLRKEDDINTLSEGGSEMLGVERRVKF